MTSDPKTPPGCLDELHGLVFMRLLDMGRFVTDTIGEQYGLKSPGDVADLRGTPNGMNTIISLASKMYSYWEAAPQGPGVYQRLVEWMKKQRKFPNPKNTEVRTQVRHQSIRY